MKISPVVASILTFAGSIATGFAGLSFTAHLFDSMGWCCFHSWALLHGSAPVVFLLWAFLGFHGAKLLMKARDQFAPIPNLAFMCSALGTLFFSEFFMWPGLALSAFALYRRFRHDDRRAAGLTWAATAISALNLTYWLYLTILFMSIEL